VKRSPTKRAGHLEVHEHCFLDGRSYGRTLVHSHEGGDRPHRHEGTGPSSYTIDKDEWHRRTGLKGGGRKKFTAQPDGPQLEPQTDLTEEELTYEFVIVGDGGAAASRGAEGPGIALPERLHQRFGLKPRLKVVP
jgi:hypothetical protein